MPPSRAACAIALVSDRDERATRRDLWDPIVEAWPAFAPRPTASYVRASDLPDHDHDLPGLSALVDLDGSENDTIALVHDRLWKQALPALMLFRDSDSTFSALNGRGVMVMRPDAPPTAQAAALAAVAERQRSFITLTSELKTAQRFQSGLTGVMDKLHEELRLAAIVQKELLPKAFPVLPGVEFQVFFRSAGYVSGDTYDIQQLDDHHIGFFIADAVGHGVPAALMTMIINRAIRMKTVLGDRYTIHEPREVLQGLNRELIRHHTEAPRFASAVYAVMDTRDRTITLAGAGHPPPLVIGPGGAEPQPVETDGSLLGVFSDDEFTQTTFALEDDQMLVLYSDGFETAFPEQDSDCYTRRLPNRRYVQRFVDLAGAWRDTDITAALTSFTDDVNAQAGSLHQLDDLTAMVVIPTAHVANETLFSGLDEQGEERPATARAA